MSRTYALPAFPFPVLVNETGVRTEALPGAILLNEAAAALTVAPAAGSIVFTGFAPTVVSSVSVSPGAGSIVFTGFAPSIVSSIILTPGAGSIVFTGFAPAPGFAAAPGRGSILFTGFAPTIARHGGPGTLAELWFAPTSGFVDLTVVANRRRFLSAIGAAQSLGTDGSAPFEVAPPLFLTSNGTPSSFAANNGRGGAFTLSSGTLASGASNPPAASETVVTYPAATARGRGVLGDYLTGNLYAFNPATLTDNGTSRRWVRRWRALPQASFAAVKFAALSIEMKTGARVSSGTGANPQLMLRWSDDGGRTWSDQRLMAAGQRGATAQTIKFNRLGATRRFGGADRVFELSCADPFAVAIIDADVDIE